MGYSTKPNGNTATGSLQLDENFFRAILEHSFDAIGILDADGNILYQSSSVEKILGYKAEERIGQHALDLIYPEDQKKARQLFSNIADRPESKCKRVLRYIHKNGSLRYLEANIINLLDHPRIHGLVFNYRDITEQKLAKLALEKRESRHRAILENAFEGVAIYDEKGAIKYQSPSVKNIFGYKESELIAQNGFDLVHPDDVEQCQKALSDLLAYPDIPRKIQVKFKHKNNSWLDTEAICINMLDNPHIKGIIVNYRDVSERVQMEKALVESEQRFRNIVESSPETIMIFDADTGKFIDFNENAPRLFGYSKEELLQLGPCELSPPLQPDGRKTNEVAAIKIKKALKSNRPVVFEWAHVHASGKSFPCEVRLVKFPGDEKKLLRATITDITERKEVEKKLKESKRNYAKLASVSPVGIFKSDINGKCIYVNKKWREITGLTLEQSKGDGWINAIHPEDKAHVLKEWHHALKGHRSSKIEYRFLSPKGKTTWVYGQASIELDDMRKHIGYVGTVTDITERKVAEIELAKSEARNKALLNAIPDMIFRISKDGVYLDYKKSNTVKPIVPPKLFLGKKIKDIFPPDLAEKFMRLIDKTLRTKKTQTYEYALPDPQNEQRENHFEVRVTASDNQEVITLVRDITKRAEDERALRKSEEKWRSLVEAAPNYIAILNLEQKITFVNKSVDSDPVSIIGLEAYKTVDKPYRKKLKKTINKVIESKQPQEITFSAANTKGQKSWFTAIYAPIAEPDPGVLALAYDITARKKAEKALKATNRKLYELTQRLENVREVEKKRMAMEIHDELGQELTAIKLSIFWLQQYLKTKEEKIEIELLRQKIEKLVELSSATISSVRRIAHELHPVVLDNLGLIPAIEWQVASLNENNKVRFCFNAKTGNKIFNKDFAIALFRVIQESSTNVLKHSKATEAEIKLHSTKNNLVLTIKDNGVGIDKKQLDMPGKIGIFSMRERLKKWKGLFEITGKKDKGTIIKITLPLNHILQSND